MGRSLGPKGPAPSSASRASRSASGSLTPTSAPNRPMNILPFTYAPRLPNIGLTSTRGSSGTSERNTSFSASVGLGISTITPPDQGSASGLLHVGDEPAVQRCERAPVPLEGGQQTFGVQGEVGGLVVVGEQGAVAQEPCRRPVGVGRVTGRHLLVGLAVDRVAGLLDACDRVDQLGSGGVVDDGGPEPAQRGLVEAVAAGADPDDVGRDPHEQPRHGGLALSVP